LGELPANGYRKKSRENYLRFLLSKIKSDCHRKRRGSEFDLSIGDVVRLLEEQKGRCAISGIEMTFTVGGGRLWTNVSIDRKDNSLGYMAGNVQLTCVGANRARHTMSMPAFVDFCRKVVEYQDLLAGERG
jgi:hypothetical protein